MDIINALLTNSKFWMALWGFAQGVLLYFAPAFPQTLLGSADVLVGVILSVLLGAQVLKDRAAAEAAKPS